MLTKEQFVQVINWIKEQNDLDTQIGKLLEKSAGSWVMFNTENKHYKALMLVLKAVFNDKEDMISWWLFEDVKKEITSFNDLAVPLETPEQLYDFLIENK